MSSEPRATPDLMGMLHAALEAADLEGLEQLYGAMVAIHADAVKTGEAYAHLEEALPLCKARLDAMRAEHGQVPLVS